MTFIFMVFCSNTIETSEQCFSNLQITFLIVVYNLRTQIGISKYTDGIHSVFYPVSSKI